MLRTLALVVLLMGAAPSAGRAQAEPGHVYLVIEWKAHPGEEGAYTQVWAERLRPILSHMVQQGTLVRFTNLVKSAGNVARVTHLSVYEFSDWNTYGNFGPNLDEAARAVIGRPWLDVQENEFVPLRDPVAIELYIAPPSAM